MPKVIIHTAGQTFQMEVASGANLLLEAASRAIPIPFQCTTGRCGTCQVQVLEGGDHLSPYSEQEYYRLADEALQSRFRFACQTYVYGDVTIRVEDQT